MPPCLLAIRSLLRSRSRSSAPPLSSQSPAQSWRNPAHHRYGTAAGGGGQRDDTAPTEHAAETTFSPLDALASFASPPIPTATRFVPIPATPAKPTGSFTSDNKVYRSLSGHRIVNLISNSAPTGAYSSNWDAAFAQLRRLNYILRQDEDPAHNPKKMLRFSQETYQLASEMHKFMFDHRMAKKEAQAASLRDHDLPVPTPDPARLHEYPIPPNWETLCADGHRLWYDVALFFLAFHPRDARDFLLATHHEPYPPISCVQDSLFHLSKLYSCVPEGDNRGLRLRLLGRTIMKVADRSTGERLSLKHDTLAIILPMCSPKLKLWIWEEIHRNHVDVHWNTHLQFANHLIHADYFEQGLEAVLEAHKAGANLDSYGFRSTCSTLLRAASRQPDGLRVSMRIVDRLVEMGVTLNLILCNVLLLNAVEALDFTTAWSIFHSLPKYGLQPDKYTFAILLKACKANLDDVDMLNETIRNIIAHLDVKTQPVLAADILHSLYMHHTRHHPEKAFETLSDAYAQLFDTAPLSELGILPPHIQPPLEGRRLPPSHSAAGVMLNAYLDQLFLQTQSPVQPLALYHRFRALVEGGTEPFASMVANDYVPNAFLTTLTKTKAGLSAAADVIKDMQRFQPLDDGRVRQCRPTARTWTIFLSGFILHGQMKLAEQVLDYMLQQGVKPDVVTWNVLVGGYAGVQDEEGVEKMLKRMRESGAGWDEFTRNAVGRLRGRKGGERASGGEKRELDFTGDLRTVLEKRIVGGGEERKESDHEGNKGNVGYKPLIS